MFSSSTFKEVSSTTSLYQHQSSYDLNQFLIDNSTASYGVDSFDLSLLSSDYAFDNYQGTQIKCEDGIDDGNNLALSIEIDNCYQYPTQSQLKQEDNLDWQQQYYLQSSSLLSPISPATTAHSSPSPCPSVEYTATIIKQEQNILLPPSPPDSNGVPSPQSIHCESYKIEQFDEQSYANQTILSPNCADNSIDIKFLLNSREQKQQDHQVLREFLEDTTFQRKHNLKPLALESLFGGLTQQGDIEPVISLALQHAKQEVQATCNALKISPDPQQWTSGDVQLWISSTIKQFKLEPIVKCELLFPENGQLFAMLNDEDFIQRVPQIGSILHAQLEIWKAAYVDSSHIDSNMLASSTAGPSSSGAAVLSMNSALSQTSLWNQMLDDDSDISEGEETEKPMEVDSSSPKSLDSVKEGETLATATPAVSKTKTPKKHHSHLQKKGTQSSHIHLWQFLKELLASPQSNGTAIRWLDRSKGIFKIEDSVRVARLWGRRKNRPAMNYDKLSRSIRQYYKKGIMKKTERSQRLVYQFCHPYSL